jgi:hypothetical protein
MFPEPRARKIGLCLFAILGLMLVPLELRADFIPPYGVPQGFLQPFNFLDGSVRPVGSWTLKTSGTPFDYTGSLIQTDPSQVSFRTGTSFERGASFSLDLQFTHTIIASGTVSFDYSLSLRATGAAAGWNFGGYLLDGVLTKLPTGTGSINVPVNAGDVFGFEAFASVNCILCEPPFNTAGDTTFTITNFNAPVPEPATTALLICGACLALARARARARLRAREVVDLGDQQLRRS